MQARDEYRNTAAVYDFLFSRPMKKLRSQICTVLTHMQAYNIIDLCCGTGEQLRMLAGNDRLLTGVDLSQAMLAKARKRGPEAIHYFEADASNLMFPDSDYDGVIISFGLHEKTAPQLEAIFQEGCRLVKPEGCLVIADYCTPPPGIDSQIMGRLLIPIIERSAGINHYHNYRDWMASGGIETFLEKNSPGRISLVAPHFRDCVRIYMISGIEKRSFSTAVNKLTVQGTVLPPREETA